MNTQASNPKPIACAFCDSTDVEFFSLFGQTLLGSQYYCNHCRSIFEVIRFDEETGEVNKGNEKEGDA